MKVASILTVAVLIVAMSGGAMAIEGFPLTVDNRLRIEYDDNIRQEKDDTEGSLKIIEQLQLIGDVDLGNTFISLRYQPSYTYWEKDPGRQQSDVHHQADFVLDHEFNPRLTLGLKDVFRYSELPELRADDQSDLVIREDNTYIYNKVDAAATYKVLTDLHLRAVGSYSTISYDENDVARRDDREITTAGVDLENAFTKKTTISGQLRYSMTDYTEEPSAETFDGELVDAGRGDRGSEALQVGGLVQHIFSPNLIGNARGGFVTKEFDDAKNDGEDAPYGDVSVTFIPSPKTRITLGGSHLLYEPDVYPYVNQTRSSFYGSVGQDLTGKLDLFISATHIKGDYDAGDVVGTVQTDESELGGEDESTQLSSRLRYNVYRSNYLELGYQFTDVSSDVRREYDRNRYWIGWQTRL